MTATSFFSTSLNKSVSSGGHDSGPTGGMVLLAVDPSLSTEVWSHYKVHLTIDKPANKLLAGCEYQTFLYIQRLMGVPSLAKLQAQSFLTMAESSALLGFWFGLGLPGIKNKQSDSINLNVKLSKHEINSSLNLRQKSPQLCHLRRTPVALRPCPDALWVWNSTAVISWLKSCMAWSVYKTT